jgi:2,3-bisphosphoglycerate-independent phosphoglycerate mutase
MEYINAVQKKMQELGVGKIATLGGRFYGMDRNNSWDRIERAYNAMTLGEGKKAANVQSAIENSYDARVNDEFVEPVVIIDSESRPVGIVQDGDSIIFFNFRADRARQISRAFVDKELNTFNRQVIPIIHYVCMTQYDVNIPAPVAFLPQNLEKTLGEVLGENGIKQLRIAETEKYAHVTFFFNGGVEEPNPGEDRILVPSPKVATYNQQPEMSAGEVTEKILEQIDRDYYDVFIINYANPDMIGHTGVLDAAVVAVKTVDNCLQQVVDKVLAKNGTLLITADHGNCEMMVSPETGSPFTAHTTNRVPFILAGEKYINHKLRSDCSLRDIAPTMLSLLGIEIPPQMTGKSLIEN